MNKQELTKQKERVKQCLLLKTEKKKKKEREISGRFHLNNSKGEGNGIISEQPIIFEQTLTAKFTNSNKFSQGRGGK